MLCITLLITVTAVTASAKLEVTYSCLAESFVAVNGHQCKFSLQPDRAKGKFSINLKTHHLIKRHDGVDIAQDIVHDKEENTVTVTLSQTSPLEYLVPTVNFHDFNTKYVVFKDIEHRMCLLTYAPIPFATPAIYKLGKTNLTLAYTAQVQNKILSNDDVRLRAGTNIGDFCADYKTLWMDLKSKYGNKLVKRDDDEPEPCAFGCGICIVETDKGYQNLGAADTLG